MLCLSGVGFVSVKSCTMVCEISGDYMPVNFDICHLQRNKDDLTLCMRSTRYYRTDYIHVSPIQDSPSIPPSPSPCRSRSLLSRPSRLELLPHALELAAHAVETVQLLSGAASQDPQMITTLAQAHGHTRRDSERDA